MRKYFGRTDETKESTSAIRNAFPDVDQEMMTRSFVVDVEANLASLSSISKSLRGNC